MEEENPRAQAVKIYEQGMKANARGNPYFAYDCFLRAIELNPDEPVFRVHAAGAAVQLSRPRDFLLDQAVQQAQLAVQLNPNEIAFWGELGQVSVNSYRYPEAIAAYEKALEINPDVAPFWGMLGFAYHRDGKKDKARDCYLEAVRLDPELGEVHFLLSTYYDQEDFDRAKQAYHGERGFMAKNKSMHAVESCWNAAHGYLGTGDYKKGWEYFEARLKPNLAMNEMARLMMRFTKPLWKGERDCTVLIHSEMGLGDILLMARYLPMLPQKGVNIIFECQKTLIDLMAFNFPMVRVVPYGQAPEEYDYQLPMMSFPWLFRTRSYTVPWSGPYIKAMPEKTSEWAKIRSAGGVPNIGVVWSAGVRSFNASNHQTGKQKSLTFEQIKPILGIPGINFVSLQVEREAELKNPGIKDFSDTAAILANLDGVVTVDTSVANLAGSMGKKMWLLDRVNHCWRYADIKTPWYPENVTILRQSKFGVWDDVLEKLHNELTAFSVKMAA